MPKFHSMLKYSTLVVKGKPVTQLQAAEIIIRTDAMFNFTSHTNARTYQKRFNELLGFEDPDDFYPRQDEELIDDIPLYIHIFDAQDDLLKRLGHLNLEVFPNYRIATCFIGGPHGWCSFDGTIGCNTYNLPKDTCSDQVFEEWEKIAATFPYLELTCQLFAEPNHSRPYYECRVSNGKVTEHSPQSEIGLPRELEIHIDMLNDFSEEKEIGISIEDLKEKLIQIYGHVPQFSCPLYDEWKTKNQDKRQTFQPY